MPRMNEARARRRSGWGQDPREPKDKSWFALGTDKTAASQGLGSGRRLLRGPRLAQGLQTGVGVGRAGEGCKACPGADTGSSSEILKLKRPE